MAGMAHLDGNNQLTLLSANDDSSRTSGSFCAHYSGRNQPLTFLFVFAYLHLILI